MKSKTRRICQAIVTLADNPLVADLARAIANGKPLDDPLEKADREVKKILAKGRRAPMEHYPTPQE